MRLEACERCSAGQMDCKEISFAGELKFDICRYNVAYINDGVRIIRKDLTVPLRFMAINLRHQVTPMLSFISTEANKLEPFLMSKHIDITNGPSRILGAVIAVEHFINMISSVIDFHPRSSSGIIKNSHLKGMIDNYYNIYSMFKGMHRPRSLTFVNNVPTNVHIAHSEDLYCNIFAVLSENIWKYSLENSLFRVDFRRTNDKYCFVSFTNRSKPLDEDIDIFDYGSKVKKDTEGFGFGLFWVNKIVEYLNQLDIETMSGRGDLIFEHKQTVLDVGLAEQVFSLKNVPIVIR